MLVLAVVNPALAGPDCNRKPDHPSCGGGGGGGSETTCATTDTFPTFAYWEDQGTSSITVLTLSDALGTCTKPLIEYDTQHYLTGETDFHYDPMTGSGRIVWTNHFIADYLFLVEFDVGEENAVTVPDNLQTIVNLQAQDQGRGTMRNLDISLDGDLFAFIYRPKPPEGLVGGYAIYTASIDGCIGDPWIPPEATGIPPDATGCSGTLTEIISADPVVDSQTQYYWRDISLSTDDSRIYLNQFINALGGGTYALEKDLAGDWVLLRPEVDDLPFPESITLLDHNENGTATEVLATSRDTAANPCGELIIVDVVDCLTMGYCDFVMGQSSIVRGKDPSWLLDGRLVYKDRIYKRQGKNYSCRSGNISTAAPLDENPAITNVLDGRDPQGWQ